jgi:hypothetical protein
MADGERNLKYASSNREKLQNISVRIAGLQAVV